VLCCYFFEITPDFKAKIAYLTSSSRHRKHMLTICPDCDLAQEIDVLETGQHAQCPRCKAELACSFGDQLDLALATLLTSAILLLLMNVFPLLEMRVQGVTRATTIVGAAYQLYAQGMAPLALLVLFTTVIGPLVEIVLLSMVLIPVKIPAANRAGTHLVKLVQNIRPWSMVEVFMLGVLVSLVKLAALAEIITGPALWACAGLIASMSFLKAMIRPEDLWFWSRKNLP
jgi:paraquat-inducible protein A